MVKNKISVIVPVYNVRNYIARCLESVLNQSCKNIELIVVDDCSTDDSGKIVYSLIDSYKKAECRVLHTDRNSGVGYTRNIGLQSASGDYVGFIDGDDWVDLDYYQNMLNAIQDSNAEIAISEMTTEYDNVLSAKIRYAYHYDSVLSGALALRLLCHSISNNFYITPIVNNKLYETSFLKEHSLKFEVDSYCEDDIFTFFCLSFAKKIAIVSGVNYHYYQRQDSLSHMFSKKVIDDLISAFVSIKNMLIINNLSEKYHAEFCAFFEKCIVSVLSRMFMHEQRSENQKRYLTYFFNRLFAQFPIEQCIEYLDTERIKNFFQL